MIAVAALTLSFVHAASAQSLPLVGSPSAISVGAFFPSSGASANEGGSSQLDVDLRYGFPVSVPMTPTRTVVSVAGEFGNKSGGHSDIIPITIGEYLGAGNKSPFAVQNFYAGVGLGAYFESITTKSSTASLGGYGTVGYNIALGFFVDAKYQIANNANGLTVEGGYRF
jgi:hypothetical protein